MGKIAEFLLVYNFYQAQVALSGEIFYTGSMWEIRKELGTLQVIGEAEADAGQGRLTYPEAFPLSDRELREYLAQPHVFTAFENVLAIHYNIKEPFVEMDEKASLIIKQLDQMLQDFN